MKNLLTIIGIMFIGACTLLAQAPQSFKYQAIARDVEGNVIADQQISLRISLIPDSESGKAVYSEIHNLQTNHFGLINIEIGNGENKHGEIANIDWKTGRYFVNIEIDVNGGSDYKSMGISQLLSVPYALYSESSGSNSKEAMSWTEAPGVTYLTNPNLVGIGTTAPASSLHVTGAGINAVYERNISTAAGPANRFYKSRGTAASKTQIQPGDNMGQFQFWGMGDDGAYNIGATLKGVVESTRTGTDIFDNAASIQFLTTNSNFSWGERMRITPDGNVGIGTAAPGYKLEVTGNVNIPVGSHYKVGGVDMVSSPWSKTGSDVYYVGGDVGIGTNNPTKRLEIYDNDWQTVRITNTSPGAGIELVSTDDDWSMNTWYGTLAFLHSTDNFSTKTDEYYFTTSEFYPYTGGSKTLGTVYRRWNNVYSEYGNFSEKVGIGIGSSSPSHPLHVEASGELAVYAYSDDHYSGAVQGISSRGYGIYGEHNDPSYTSPAIFGKNTGSGIGVLGDAYTTGGSGVYGRAQGTSGVNYGVRGKTYSSSGYAGYFEGGENYFEGNVGIGTTSPSYPLHVVSGSSNYYASYIYNNYTGSSSKIGQYVSLSSDGTGTRYGNYAYVNPNDADASSSYGGYFYVSSNAGTGNTYGVYGSVSTSGTGSHWAGYFPSGDTYIGGDLRVGWTGDVPGYIAAFDGKVICEELRVALSGDWPDYVFDDEYDLMPISELEKNIKENKHLPGIPSAKEIEDGGIMVGDMAENLTKKVEELSLYIIELNKRIEKLEKENQKLHNK